MKLYNRTCAMIMATTFGLLGIDKFYMGYIGQGIVRLLLTVSCFFAPVSALWAVISAIRIGCGSAQPKEGKWKDDYIVELVSGNNNASNGN